MSRASLPATVGRLCAAAVLLHGGGTLGQAAHWTDSAGDAVLRPTDAAGAVVTTSTLPDLLSLTLQGWEPSEVSPYEGHQVGPGGIAPTLRLDVVFAGLVNPPGELGLIGTYSAFSYGPNPVYGFFEIDVDGDANTGGELPGAAGFRYLANVGRFGTTPPGFSHRSARSIDDLDDSHQSSPHYERSGADFALVLCGCHEVQVVEAEGNDLVFSAGETWVVRSRFFQRAGGYAPVSAVVGGSNFGEYDPLVDLRFQHDAIADTTTITLVFPLNEMGASLLTGEPVQPTDPWIGFGSHASVVEALQDLVYAAEWPSYGHPITVDMIARWEGRNPRNYLDPTQWTVRAIVGTAYDAPSDGLYVWTDVGFGEVRGDVNGDGSADSVDNELIEMFIAAEDGGPNDADSVINGQVQIAEFGYNFSVYDVNGDGLVNSDDLNAVREAECRADWDRNGLVEVQDLLAYLDEWFALRGDLNADDRTSVQDLLIFLDAFFQGC